MNQAIIKTIDLGDGRTITIETGRLAKQADGAVVVRMGDTMLLATVVSATEAKDDVDFMPLAVDYREKYSAAGRFPGGFLKREARPSDDEILIARLIDRALRPLFPADFHAETAMMISLMTFVITWVNVGLGADFLSRWMKAFGIAYVVGVPVIFFLAPVARKLTGRILGVNPA